MQPHDIPVCLDRLRGELRRNDVREPPIKIVAEGLPVRLDVDTPLGLLDLGEAPLLGVHLGLAIAAEPPSVRQCFPPLPDAFVFTIPRTAVAIGALGSSLLAPMLCHVVAP